MAELQKVWKVAQWAKTCKKGTKFEIMCKNVQTCAKIQHKFAIPCTKLRAKPTN